MKFITICNWVDQEKESFKHFINGVSCCTRCGSTHNYKKYKLPNYLKRLQLIAGENGIAFPISLDYSLNVTRTEEVKSTKGFIKKVDVTEIKEYGTVFLNLYFKDELSDEDYKTWKSISWGFFAGLKEI